MAQDVLQADLLAAREAMSEQPTLGQGHLAHITVVTIVVAPSEAIVPLPVSQALLRAAVPQARLTAAAVVIAAAVVPSVEAAVEAVVPSVAEVVAVAVAVPSVEAAVAAIDNRIMCSTHLYSTIFQNNNNENKIFFDCGCHAHRHDCHGTGNV